MKEKIFRTDLGDIHYFISKINDDAFTLVFLPGLTADHRLFDKQLDYFKDKYNMLVWDAPGHNLSRPFELSFDLKNKAAWLKEIIDQEKIRKPIIIGQSMGGYVGQMFCELYPNVLSGFVVIDSAPLQRSYYTGIELWLLKRMEPIYYLYPWNSLVKAGSKGVATSKYGQELMKEMMLSFDSKEYAKLAGHGYKILAEAIELNSPYEINCPVILICGEKDKAGSCIRYDVNWHKNTNIPLYWIKDAGHNSNTDRPEEINKLILDFVNRL